MRKEFPSKVMLAAWQRSGGNCEKCSAKLYPGTFAYDHRIPDQMGGEPTLENCNVVCRSCHTVKTRKDVAQIAKAKRRERKHIGAKKARSPIRGWRKFDGTPVRNPKVAGR